MDNNLLYQTAIKTVLDKKGSDNKNDSSFDYDLEMNRYQTELNLKSNSNNYLERSQVGRNIKTSIETLDKLSRDPEFIVRESVAKNPNCPVDILERLANDNTFWVRNEVAENTNSTFEILKKLSNDENNIVKARVAMNPECPMSIFAILALDKDTYIHEQIIKWTKSRKHLMMYYFLNHTRPLEIKEELEKNPEFLNEIILLLKNSPNVAVKTAILDSDLCPKETYEILSKDKSSYVRSIVARKEKTPIEILDYLSYDVSKDVLKSVFSNPSSPIKVKYRCLSAVNDKDLINKTIPKEYLALYELNVKSNNIEEYKDVLYYIVLKRYNTSSSVFNKNTKEIISKLNFKVKDGSLSEELLYFIHEIPSLYYNFDNESLKIINSIYQKSKTYFRDNTSYKDYYLLKIKNSITSLFENTNEDNTLNIYPYIESLTLVKNTSKTVKTSFSSLQNINTGSKFKIKCNSIKYILDRSKDGIVEFGYYPQDKISSGYKELLDILFENNMIKESNEKYTFDYVIGKKECPVYIVNSRKFIKYNSDWVEIKPIKWVIDKDNMTLTSKNDLSGLNLRSENKILKSFFEEVIEPYSLKLNEVDKNEMMESIKEETKENEEIKRQNHEQNTLKELNNMKQTEDNNESLKLKKKQEKEKLSLRKLELLKELDEVEERLSELNSYLPNNKIQRIQVNLDSLILKVDDHFEFNPKYLPYLAYIDLSYVKTKDLKLSGIDFSKANLYVFDPKSVYKMDFSGSSFNKSAFVLKDFSGCDLRGTNLSQVTDCTGYENALVDENTILPKNVEIGLKK